MDAGDDRPAFETWVATRGDALMRFAYLVTGDRERAADAVQDALVGACARWERIVERGDPEAYLRRCVVNADTSRWRRFQRRERPEADATRLAEPDAGVDVAQAVVLEETLWALGGRLPARQRAAVVLRYYEDRSDTEIAAILECSVSTVRSQIHRGLATLHDWLAATEEAATP
ncbi:SigE family RNA polymerase sigma factor [Prauserella muralis]|uniref:Uncharacterized protein n=1 Tax=Prauserella muralis TaxID=588067 RepID=A0A2V4B3C9_9PSEU|nr:SigE family RNA polymerase sigma factor [Prauserella muralis]PXY27898.1 hypothetical protein BAY60_16205 [Prauserella muralis]TWE22323.1 RNA polymerase sigma-70 factor (sigma-E family) [Prauserella muralis]